MNYRWLQLRFFVVDWGPFLLFALGGVMIFFAMMGDLAPVWGWVGAVMVGSGAMVILLHAIFGTFVSPGIGESSGASDFGGGGSDGGGGD